MTGARHRHGHRSVTSLSAHASAGLARMIVAQVESWWIWTEDSNNEHFYHTEYFSIQRKQHGEVHKLVYTIPIFEPLPPQYFVRYGALQSDQCWPSGQR